MVECSGRIRWLNPHSGSWCDDAISYLRDHIADPRLSDDAEALAALAALLAVVERDTEVIQLLTRMVKSEYPEGLSLVEIVETWGEPSEDEIAALRAAEGVA